MMKHISKYLTYLHYIKKYHCKMSLVVSSPKTDVVSNSIQELTHCLPSGAVLLAKGLQRLRVELSSSLMFCHSLSLSKAEHIGLYHCSVPLNTHNSCPEGRISMTHQLRESTVPLLTDVVCTFFAAQGTVEHVPCGGWETWPSPPELNTVFFRPAAFK